MLDAHFPTVNIRNCEDGSYATGDLFELHETIPNAWRYFGRSDDLLIHSSGEKTNPIPSEYIKLGSRLGVDAL